MKFLMCPSRCSSLKKQGIVFITLIVLLPSTLLVRAQTRPGYVYDYAGILDESELGAINNLCSEIDSNTTAEVVVVILENLNEYDGSIEAAKLDYANRKSLEGITGIGKAGTDNGVLLLISYNDREWSFEIGYGLEGLLTDSESGRIGREAIVPNFLAGDYYYGIFIAVALVGEELGYDVEDVYSLDEGLNDNTLLDYLLEDPLLLIWWVLEAGADVDFMFLLLLILAIVFLFSIGIFSGGGGRSGGGGSSGKW